MPRIPVPSNRGGPDPQDANDDGSEGRADVPRDATHRVEPVLDQVQDLHEDHADDGAQDPEPEVEDELDGVLQRVLGHPEDRAVAEEPSPDRGCRHRRQDHGREPSRGEALEDHLEREEDPGEGRVERRGDPRGRTRRHQRPRPAVRHLQGARDHRAEGRTDLDDRALASGGAPGADRDGRGERLHRGDARADPPAAKRDRLHHLGDAVPARLVGEPVDERAGEEAAEHRADHDRPAPEEAGGRPHDREEDVGERLDQEVQADGCEAGNGADRNGDQHQRVRLAQPREPQTDGPPARTNLVPAAPIRYHLWRPLRGIPGA